ncbi:MAG: right-handed parallel beta-helix repeat-containing protein, partial [Verrucomicrobiota bacterium]
SIEPEKLEVIGDPKIRERIIEKEAIEHIRQLNLRELGITDYGEFKSRGFRRPYKNPGLELFINGKAMEKARWPNEGFVDIGRIVDKGGVPRYGDFSNRGGTFTYGYDRPKHWLEAEDLFVSGNFSESFADDRLRVAKIDPEKKTMTMAHAHLYGLKSGKVYTNYFAVNLLEEIDQPGEWYLDRKSGIAYVYPPKGGVDTIQVSLLDEPMIALEGVSHVSFEGITFEVMRDMAVYMERGRNNLIAGCTFRNIGLLAVCMGKGAEAPDGEYSYGHHESTTYKPATAVSRELGELDNWLYHDTVFYRDAGYDHGVLSCDIYNLGAGAVHLGGGNRKTLEPGGNFVRNCHIRDFNRLDRSYRAAVNVTGCGNVIAHNLIHDAPDMAIYLHGNDHVIEYNHVHHVMLENNEGGWFYMGRDLSELGNVIRYNFAHHVGVTEDGREGDRTEGSAGIYIDDRGSGVEVYGNVLYKTGRGRGAILYKASDVKVRNNIFIECQHAICARAWEFGIPENIEKTFGPDSLFAQRLFAVDYLKPPYIERYPFIADYLIAEKSWKSRRNVTENNVLVGMDEKQMFLVQNGGDVGLGENFITSGDPGFVDADKLDFRLRKDSVVFRQLPDFKPIPFEKIGLFSDEFRSVR